MNTPMFVTENEKQHLLEKYQSRRVFHGQLHDHAATGGTSDGKIPLSDWVIRMKELQLDFAAILDHRQVRHMYLPQWKQALFLCGTEPGTHIPDSHASFNEMHYNLLVDRKVAGTAAGISGICFFRRFRRTFYLSGF